MECTLDGNVYFYNTLTGDSAWELPSHILVRARACAPICRAASRKLPPRVDMSDRGLRSRRSASRGPQPLPPQTRVEAMYSPEMFGAIPNLRMHVLP